MLLFVDIIECSRLDGCASEFMTEKEINGKKCLPELFLCKLSLTELLLLVAHLAFALPVASKHTEIRQWRPYKGGSQKQNYVDAT